MDFIKAHITGNYDNIIINPPYIKIQDLSPEYRKYLKKNYPVLQEGLIDIYYAFIIKCLDLLNDNGVMVAITPNSYLYNKSSFNLRKYLFDNSFVQEIIDFKDKKVFENASVYCCITVFTKTKKTQLLYNDTVILYSDIITNYNDLLEIRHEVNTHYATKTI
jgi:adenine-specific DNA-methyltransferase